MLSLRHPIPSFGSFSFFQTSLWFGVDKVLQKITKSWKSEVRHLYQWCNLIPKKCPRKTPLQHTVPPSPMSEVFLLLYVSNFDQFWPLSPYQLSTSFMNGPLSIIKDYVKAAKYRFFSRRWEKKLSVWTFFCYFLKTVRKS